MSSQLVRLVSLEYLDELECLNVFILATACNAYVFLTRCSGTQYGFVHDGRYIMGWTSS